jgi:hypothetical protein
MLKLGSFLSQDPYKICSSDRLNQMGYRFCENINRKQKKDERQQLELQSKFTYVAAQYL